MSRTTTEARAGHRRPIARLLLAATVVLLGGIVYLYHAVNSPDVILLLPEGGAEWIRIDAPIALDPWRSSLTTAAFRTTIASPQAFAGAPLRVKALKSCVAYLDGVPLLEVQRPGGVTRPDAGPVNPTDWKQPRLFQIPRLPPGRHELVIIVRNRYGPALVLAECPALDLRTGPLWQAMGADGAWTAAAAATKDFAVANASVYAFSAGQILGILPVPIALFSIALFLIRRQATPEGRSRWFSARRVRWLILLGWAVLAVNNIGKIPYYLGFDAEDHFQYIRFIADNRRLPQPSEGWEFFQPPLYYLLSAPLYRAIENRFPFETGVKILRIVPLLCGIALVELCYRSLRNVFPERDDLQAIGTAVAGLLPMNVYMAQYISNEPFAAVLAGCIVLWTCRLLRQSRGGPAAENVAPPPRPAGSTSGAATTAIVTALLLAAAFFAKISTVILLLPVCGALAVALRRRGFDRLRVAGALAIVVCVVAGCAVVRFHHAEGGAASVTGWDPERVGCWQEPGYRVPQHFLRFGRALAQPILAGPRGIWDSLYSTMWADGFVSGVAYFPQRPPWNYRLLLWGIWLAVVPTCLMIAGAITGGAVMVDRPIVTRLPAAARDGVAFAAAVAGLFLAAQLHIYLSFPTYAFGKASYMLSATPCFAILAAAGFEVLVPRRAWPRAIVGALIATWAGLAYLTYFVV